MADAPGDPNPGAEPAAADPSPAMPQVTPRDYLKLVLIGGAIGIPAALVAALFLAIVHWCEDWLWTDLPDALGHSEPPSYLVIGLPVVGALLVLAARRFLPGDGGHRPLLGIGGGATPVRDAPGIALAALGTLAFGAVLGPEAPLIALGSVTGMVAVDALKVRGRGADVLATAGSFSAVSALFGGPLVAGVLLLEGGVGLGAAVLPALLPGLVAAAVGYVMFEGLGSWGGLDQSVLAVPNLPLYDGTHVLDLVLAVVVGIVTAALVIVVRRLAGRIDVAARARMIPILLAGALAVGLLAELARLLGDNSQDVLFSGQASIPAEIAESSIGALLVLLLAKALAYGVSLGCGYRGGPVFPAIFLGVGVASFAVVLWDVSPTWAVAVGTAAGMAAGTRLVFSSVLFATLLVGSAGGDAISAAVLATAAAWMTATAIDKALPPPAEPAPTATT